MKLFIQNNRQTNISIHNYSCVKFIFIVAILLFGSLLCHAQSISGKLSGRDQSALESVTITLREQNDSTLVKFGISDNNGQFELTNLSDGVYSLSFAIVGYESKSIDDITMVGKTVNLGIIQINPSVNSLEEITVNRQKPLIERKIDRFVFNLNESLLANTGSLFEALRVTPFLNATETSISMVGKGGMEVMIDEKPIHLSGTDLVNYLKTLKSANIERIEIITSPPAKYGAQGNSGIVNIVMKMDDSLGWKTSINANYNQNYYSSIDGSVTFEYRSKKIRTTIDFNPYKYRSIIREKNNITGSSDEIFTEFVNQSTNPAMTARINTDYEINDRNNVGVILQLSSQRFNTQGDNNTLFSVNSGADSSLFTLSEINNKLSNRTLNLYHDLKLDTSGMMLYTSLNYFSNNPKNKNNFTSTSETQVASVQNNNFSDYRIWSMQSDLNIPREWGSLETGAKFSRIKNASDVSYFERIDDDFLINPNRSNEFEYEEDNIAAYISADRKLSERWSAKAGLRYEYTTLDGYSVTMDERNQSSYGALFPTAYLLYKSNDNHIFSLNYSRRIDRPRMNTLNPFRIYLNLYNSYEGNPYLRPAFSNNLEFNYLLNGMFSFTTFASQTTNLISSLTLVEGPTTTIRPDNYLTQKSVGTYISFSRKILKWWENNTNLSFSYIAPESEIETIKTNNGTSASFAINNNFKARNNLGLFVNYGHNFPSTYGNIRYREQQNLRLGGNLRLLDGNFSLNASYFIGSVVAYDVFFSEYQQSVRTDYNYNTIIVGLTYIFGKTKVSGNDKSVRFEEMNRAKN